MSELLNALKESLTRALAEGPRSGFIAHFLAHPLYCLASRINVQHFEALARHVAVRIQGLHWPTLDIGSPQRLAVVCKGRLYAHLVQKLICFRSERDVKRAMRHAIAVLSQRHFVGLKDRAAACVSTLQGHGCGVCSVAFHPSAPYLATGSRDNTAKLWLLSENAATCIYTLQEHNFWVNSVAFHPSAPYLVTGSDDCTAKLWLLSENAPTCVYTLRGHSGPVNSVAFHPFGPYLMTGSNDSTTKLWLLSENAPACVSTLQEQCSRVNSVAFHPSAPYLAIGSNNGTTKLWR
jgi:hypothetical protein